MSAWRAKGLTAFGLCATLLVASSRADEVSELLPMVPEGANTIAVLRVKDLTGSPRGLRENWAEKHEQEFLDGTLTIPPWVTSIVRTSYFRPGMQGGEWSSILLPLPEAANLDQIAEREKVEIQQISGHAAVLSPRRNGYFVMLKGASEGPGRILGGLTPATRQEVSRWIQEIQQGDAGVSDYLSKAASTPDAQLVMAIDLHELLDPIHIRYRLEGSPVVKEHPGTRAALTIDLQSLTGAKLAVRVGEETSALITVDFARAPGEEGKLIKPLLVELLNDMGAPLDELPDAKVGVVGQSVLMEMPLSDTSLRRILSLITAPPTHAGTGRSVAATTQPSPPTPNNSRAREVTVPASKRYFKTIDRCINDLHRAYSSGKAYNNTAQWHDNFARRIEEIPPVGVDPELLKFGQRMADDLRALGQSLQGTVIKVDLLNNQVQTNVDVQPAYYNGFDWWWGGAWTVGGQPYYYGQPVNVQVNSNLPEIRAKQAEVVAEGAPERDKLWSMIMKDRNDMLEAMTKKYGEEFTRGL